MLARASYLKTSENFWAAVVVTVGTALVLASLLGSHGVMTRLSLGWPIVALVLCGLVLLWGPIILIVAILIVPVFAPLVSSVSVIWRPASLACFVGRRPELPTSIATPGGPSQ